MDIMHTQFAIHSIIMFDSGKSAKKQYELIKFQLKSITRLLYCGILLPPLWPPSRTHYTNILPSQCLIH